MGNKGREAITAAIVVIIAIIIMLILIVSGCTAPTQSNQPNKKLTATEAASPVPDDKGKWVEIGTVQIVSQEPEQQQQQAGEGKTQTAVAAKPIAKNFYEFDKATYDDALKEGKYVFLDFYANWCPICKAEEPEIKAAFNELEARNVIGFRVNYNDDQTDESDKALAKKLGVAYQHTKILITADEKVVSRTLVAQTKQEVLKQIKDSLAAK